MAEASIQFRPRSKPPLPTGTSGPKTTLEVEGMTCGNCARHVSDALQGVAGVGFANVDLLRGQATVSWKAGAPPQPAALLAAVQAAGFEARLPAAASDRVRPTATSPPPNPWRLPIAVGLPATLILLVADWALHLGMNRVFHWCSFALALPVQILAGKGFYRGAWNQLRQGASNMDTLVALGSTAAFGFSVWALFTRAVPHLFFTEAVTILTLVSLGHWLEARMSARAGDALRALLELAPAQARKLVTSPAGPPTEVEVPAANLVPGDRVVLRPGDRVPVDADVTEGESTADESMLTGESMPIEKRPGDRVLAGTLNQSGRLVARATAVGEETAVAAIVAAVQRAQSSRAQVQRMADTVSSVFVPIVVAIAVGAAAFWYWAPETARSVNHALAGPLWHAPLPDSPLAAAVYVLCSVLIVACPCAMGLATPVALMAGVNAAARRGILIRDAQALEKSGTIDTLVFDKTGTLTEGRPAVVATEILWEPQWESTWRTLAASLARASHHPLSQAVARLAEATLPIGQLEEVRGAGLRARAALPDLDLKVPAIVRLGSLRWLTDEGVHFPDTGSFAEQAFESGASWLGLAVGDRLVAQYAVLDPLRPEAPQLVQALRSTPSSHRVYLLSGDHPRVVESVAQKLGVDGAFAGVRPEEKAGRLQELQAAGRHVAFVGDGINDAPALAQANLGIAVARAADAAREAADVILLRSGLGGVQEALGLAKATLRTIRQNLFWAFFYNAAAVPLAALGMLSPVICALSMGFSDVLVIGNALRLLRKKNYGHSGKFR